jgi:archaemetzincin
MSPQVLERTAKVALHELGHLFSLVHCEDSHCVMHFSGQVDALDKIPPYFCKYCNAALSKIHKVEQRYGHQDSKAQRNEKN